MNQLNIPTVPHDIYTQVMKSLESHEMHSDALSIPKKNQVILEENGSLYSDAFNPWLSDWRVSEAQMLLNLESEIAPFPGLTALSKSYKKQSRLPFVQAIREGMNLRMYQHEFMKALTRARAFVPPTDFGYGEDFNLILAESPDVDVPMSYNSRNISQYHRDSAAQLRPYAFDMLTEAHGHMIRLCKRMNWTFHFRPMFTLKSAMHREIHAQMLRSHVSDPSVYMSGGQRAIQETMTNHGISLFAPWALDTIQDEYWDWYYQASYAYISDDNDDTEIHFGPWNLPPTLFCRPSDSVPYFSMPQRATFHVGHSLYCISKYYQEAGTQVGHWRNQMLTAVADLLPVICGCVSLICATTPTGQGQHRPMWTQAPFSKGMIEIFPHACALAIQKARELI